jgi:methionine-gamma-lyase
MEDESDLSGASPRRRPKPDVLAINNRRLKPSTLMMGHGYDPALSEGSLKAPIFLTSTFVFENAAAGKRHFEGVTGKRPGGAEGLVYSRFNGPNQEILEDRLGLWEDAEDALTFSSGMSAIATLLLTFVQPGDVIVHSGPLYAATETLIGRILGKFGVTWLDFPAGATRAEIEAVMDRAKVRGASRSSIWRARPTPPTRWSTSRPSRPRAPPCSARTRRRRSRSTTPSWGRSGRNRLNMARTCRSIRSPNMQAGIAIWWRAAWSAPRR